MKHRPECAKMACESSADVMIPLPMFGPIYFCAEHGLPSLKEVAADVL